MCIERQVYKVNYVTYALLSGSVEIGTRERAHTCVLSTMELLTAFSSKKEFRKVRNELSSFVLVPRKKAIK